MMNKPERYEHILEHYYEVGGKMHLEQGESVEKVTVIFQQLAPILYTVLLYCNEKC